MFFKNNKEPNKNEFFTKVAALLIHAAKIDENFSKEEGEIIKQALIKIGAKKDQVDKNMDEKNKIEIIESLWQIIYSNKDADIYETSLMRRLAGLLYIDNKIMGDIKDRIKKENS